MQLTLLPSIDLDLDIHEASDKNQCGKYVVTGPPAKLEMLHAIMGSGGKSTGGSMIKPLQRVTSVIPDKLVSADSCGALLDKTSAGLQRATSVGLQRATTAASVAIEGAQKRLAIPAATGAGTRKVLQEEAPQPATQEAPQPATQEAPQPATQEAPQPATQETPLSAAQEAPQPARSSFFDRAPSPALVEDVPAIEGLISPIAPITLPADSREVAGIPLEATSFCFAYPVAMMEDKLEKLNLADEPWGFFLLIGGFCYFDDAGKVVGVNALTLVPSRWIMEFDGPHRPSTNALKSLYRQERMCEVTLDALESAGFRAFGWVHAASAPNETVKDVIADSGMSNEVGGFVYEMIGAEPNFFMLAPLSDEQINEFKGLQEEVELFEGGVRGFFRRLWAFLLRDLHESRRETEAMNKLLQQQNSAAYDKTKHRKRSKLFRIIWVVTTLIAIVFGLGSIAYVNRHVFEVLATLIWYGCFAFVSWVPLRDTASLQVTRRKAFRHRFICIHTFLALIPVCAVILAVITAFVTRRSDLNGRAQKALRAGLDLSIEILGLLALNLFLPLTLYYMRRRTALDLARDKDHMISAARQDYLTASVSASVSPLKTGAGKGGSVDLTPQRSRPAAPSAAPDETDRAAPSATTTRARTGTTPARYTGGLVLKRSHMHLLSTCSSSRRSGDSSRGTPSSARIQPAAQQVTPLKAEKSRTEILSPRSDATSDGGGGSGDGGSGGHTSRHLLGGRRGRLPTLQDLQPGGKARRAATMLQSRLRMKVARRKYKEDIAKRRARLTYFSWPIYIASLSDLVLGTVMLELLRQGLLHEDYILLYPLFGLAPGILIVLYDLRRDVPPRFSITHCVFLISVLYRISYRAAQIDTLLLEKSESLLANQGYDDIAAKYAPMLTMVGHFVIFIAVTALGKLSLTLVSTKNACTHLLFPFQFFDFIFLYVFFSLRNIQDGPFGLDPLNWALQQCMLQVNIILRNSGTTDAFLRRFAPRLIECGRKKFKDRDPNDDPLFRLQFLARVAIQYDFADLTAIFAVPSIVSFFVWRDGFFTLEGSGVLVRDCDLWSLWIRFAVLCAIKPVGMGIARLMLARKMRKTLLGKRTIHGTSSLAAKLMAESGIVKGSEADRDAQLHKDFKFTVEELEAVKGDLSLLGLNFALLRNKLMRKVRFFAAVAVLQCFVAFPVRATAPMDATAQYMYSFIVPQHSVWMYVPPDLVQAMDPTLAEEFLILGNCSSGYRGWT